MAEVVKIKFEVDKSQLDGAISSSKTLEQELKKAGVSAQNMDAAMEGVNDALQEAGVDAKTFAKALDQSATSTKSLKTQLAEAKNEAVRMSQQFGAFSKEAQTAAQKAAEIKDEIDDLNDTLDALNPEAKLNAFVKLGQGIQGGFQAATGALQVFGVENERITKLAQQFQGVLNLTQGINSVLQLKDVYGQLRLVLGLTTTAQQGLNTAEVSGTAATRGLTAALAANPFTAVAVAIAAVVSGIYLYISATEDSTDAVAANNEELERQIENQNRLAEAYQNTATKSSRAIQDQQLRLRLASGEIDDLQAKLLQNELNRQRAVQEFVRDYGNDVVEIAKINKQFGIEAQIIRAEDAVKKYKKTAKEAKEETIKLLVPIGLDAIKANTELLKLSSEGFQSVVDALAIMEASPYEVKKANEELKRSLEALEPEYAKIAKLSTEIKPVGFDEDIKDIDDAKNAYRDYVQVASDSISVIQMFANNAREREKQDLENKYKDGLISEEKYQKELSKIKRKQAIQDRNFATFQIAIDTAQAIMQAAANSANPVLIAAMAALGAAQIAAVQSAPLPQYKKGTLNLGGGNLDADGGQVIVAHRGEAIIPREKNISYHPAIEAIYNGRISPKDINGFVEYKLSGRIPSSINAKLSGSDLRQLKPSESVVLRNSSALARQIGREIAANINLRRQ